MCFNFSDFDCFLPFGCFVGFHFCCCFDQLCFDDLCFFCFLFLNCLLSSIFCFVVSLDSFQIMIKKTCFSCNSSVCML